MMARFDNPLFIVVNVVGGLVWLAAVVDVLRTKTEEWGSTGRKAFSVLVVVGLSLFVKGVYIPVAPLLWFTRSGVLRRRGLRRRPTLDARVET